MLKLNKLLRGVESSLKADGRLAGKKCPSFCGTGNLLPRRQRPFSVTPFQSCPHPSCLLRYILILPSHVSLFITSCRSAARLVIDSVTQVTLDE